MSLDNSQEICGQIDLAKMHTGAGYNGGSLVSD